MCRAAIFVLAIHTEKYGRGRVVQRLRRRRFLSEPSLESVLFLSTVQYSYVHPHSVRWVMLPENDDNDLENKKNIIYSIITMSVGRSTCRLCVYILSELNSKCVLRLPPVLFFNFLSSKHTDPAIEISQNYAYIYNIRV